MNKFYQAMLRESQPVIEFPLAPTAGAETPHDQVEKITLTEKTYIGRRLLSGKTYVMACGPGDVAYELPLIYRTPRCHGERVSPNGFDWGYSGTGAAQLALALLTDALGEDLGGVAEICCMAFKDDVVAGLAENHWVLTHEEVEAWVERYLRRGEGQ